MPDPGLVVDLGSVSPGAAVVVGDQATLLREPPTGAQVWATPLPVEAGRSRHAARVPRGAAGRGAAGRPGRAPHADRCPASYQVPDRRRDVLISAGEAAGFAEVELFGAGRR
jgi:hypothetical protein